MIKDRNPIPVFLFCMGICRFSSMNPRRSAPEKGGNMKIKKFGSTEARIYELVRPIAEENGLIVWDVRFEKEGAMWYLCVFLDHMERPVNITDCENVTRPLNKLLDDTDPIPQTYTLEVGSAGLERELIRETHFDACEGSKVRVRMIRPLENGEKELVGTLTGFDKEQITVTNGDTAQDIALSGVAFVKLADFDEDEVRRADQQK
jgi:ribosome maturation factor RimP